MASTLTGGSRRVTRFFFLAFAACRTRSSPINTLPRLVVRRVGGLIFFPLASPLRSTGSAPDTLGSFVGFFATVEESDFCGSCVIGYGSPPSRCGPWHRNRRGPPTDLPVPVQGACVHARVFDHAGSARRLRWRALLCCLPLCQRRRRPGLKYYRGSMAGLHVPLSTLRDVPCGRSTRMTRGQHGSLHLYCEGLAPLTPCRSPGALAPT